MAPFALMICICRKIDRPFMNPTSSCGVHVPADLGLGKRRIESIGDPSLEYRPEGNRAQFLSPLGEGAACYLLAERDIFGLHLKKTFSNRDPPACCYFFSFGFQQTVLYRGQKPPFGASYSPLDLSKACAPFQSQRGGKIDP